MTVAQYKPSDYPIPIFRHNSQNTPCRLRTLNLLRWNDVPRTSRIFGQKLQYFLSFKYNWNITQAKRIINLLLLSNFYPVTHRRIQKWRRILVCGLVTRYGPLLAQEVKQGRLLYISRKRPLSVSGCFEQLDRIIEVRCSSFVRRKPLHKGYTRVRLCPGPEKPTWERGAGSGPAFAFGVADPYLPQIAFSFGRRDQESDER